MVIYFCQEEQKSIFSVSVFERVSVLFSGTQKTSSDNSSGWVSVLPLSVKNTKDMSYKYNKNYNHLKIMNTCRIQETSIKLVLN